MSMRIAVIGGGPSGSVASALLAERGHSVFIFDKGGRPNTLAGESLVPGVIPILRKLDIEERVAAISVLKPGVSFYPGGGKEFAFSFTSLPRKNPQYAYNVPRPAFDNLLQSRALELGAIKVNIKAELHSLGDRLLLSPDTLESVNAWQGVQPDLIIDASGRRRMSSKLLDIQSETGPRRDVAFFAHFHGFFPETPSGQVRINRLSSGWAWRIPLKDKMSVGVVMSQKDAAELGASSAERLDAAIRRDPVLSQESKDLKRVSEVRTYGNYQLIAHRGSGENWAAVGDAFGFVDPMLSPGMMVAMDSALQLCKELERFPIREALERYSKRVTDELSSWMDLISYFYNGRIFELHDAGKAFQSQYHYLPLGFMESFMSKNMAGMASGFTTSSPFSRGVLKNMDRWVLGGSATDQKYAII